MKPPMPDPRISIVIPAYNEAKLLPRLLDSIDVARGEYGDRASVEVIVADNASTDATARIARERGCRVAAVAKRVIAASRNGGAAIARGGILAFIDADSQVHPRTFVEIERALADPRIVGGATGVRMERMSTGIALTYSLLVPFVWITGMDTGVVFCRKADFDAVGGYDETRIIAEDVAFLWSLRRLGRSRGQRLVRLRRVKALGSTRKFDEFGDWHYFPLMAQGVRYLLRRGGSEFTDRYWYRPRR
jgi:glycosyltransferase involved in cell wall biosynthesis